MGTPIKGKGPGTAGPTKKGKGPVIPVTTNVTFCVTMSLADANNLLVAVSNAINNAAAKKGKQGGGKGK